MTPTHMQRRALTNLTDAVLALEYDMNNNTDTQVWKRSLANVESRIACLSLYLYKASNNEEESRLTDTEH